MGSVLAATQRPLPPMAPGAKVPKKASVDECLNLLVNAFVRGSGELLKSSISRELRVGVTQVSDTVPAVYPCFTPACAMFAFCVQFDNCYRNGALRFVGRLACGQHCYIFLSILW